MMEERKPGPMWAMWNETRGRYVGGLFAKMNAEHLIEFFRLENPDESFRLVKLVEASLEDGGDVS